MIQEVENEVAPRFGPRPGRTRSRGPRRAIARGRVATARQRLLGALMDGTEACPRGRQGWLSCPPGGADQDGSPLPVRSRPDAHGCRVLGAVPGAAERRQPGIEPDLRGVLPGRRAGRWD